MRGAEALFTAIFGLANRWGRLPVTYYSSDMMNQLDMYDFSQTGGSGRTYRYYQGNPTFSFGDGLSYTNFKLDCSLSHHEGTNVDGVLSVHDSPLFVSCDVENTGDMDGDDVILVYHRQTLNDYNGPVLHPVPIKSLVAFDRIHVKQGEAKKMYFPLSTEDFLLTNEEGVRVLYEGKHFIIISDGTNKNRHTFRVHNQGKKGGDSVAME
jgi:beta-glucosidase